MDAKSNRDRYSTALIGGMGPYTTRKDVMEIASGRITSMNQWGERSPNDSESWLMDKTLYELDFDISSRYHYDCTWESSFHRDSLRRLPGLSLGMSQKFRMHAESELV